MEILALFVSCASMVAAGVGIWYAHRSLSAARSAVLEAHAALQGVGASAPTVLAGQQRELTKQFGDLVRSFEALKDDVFTQLGSQDAKLVSWRADVEVVLSAVEDVLEHTERKRRKIAQVERRAAELEESANPNPAATEAETDPFKMTREQLNQLVREREARGLN